MFKDVTYADCVHFCCWHKGTLFRECRVCFILGLSPQRWVDLIFQWAEHKHKKWVLSPAIFNSPQFGPTYRFPLRRRHAAAVGGTTWKPQHNEKWKVTFLKSAACFLWPEFRPFQMFVICPIFRGTEQKNWDTTRMLILWHLFTSTWNSNHANRYKAQQSPDDVWKSLQNVP